MSPLATLSDKQRAMVLNASERIPPVWRNRFLEACTDQLFGLKQITDSDVSEAVYTVACRLHVNLAVEGGQCCHD